MSSNLVIQFLFAVLKNWVVFIEYLNKEIRHLHCLLKIFVFIKKLLQSGTCHQDNQKDTFAPFFICILHIFMFCNFSRETQDTIQTKHVSSSNLKTYEKECCFVFMLSVVLFFCSGKNVKRYYDRIMERWQ